VTDDGDYSEYVLVPTYRYLVKVDATSGLSPVDLAPLTDAGLTPYRAIKKVRHLLGPGKSVGNWTRRTWILRNPICQNPRSRKPGNRYRPQ
jgi:NADPH:quinone reductase-like Zn-dependent oxidoreductase